MTRPLATLFEGITASRVHKKTVKTTMPPKNILPPLRRRTPRRKSNWESRILAIYNRSVNQYSEQSLLENRGNPERRWHPCGWLAICPFELSRGVRSRSISIGRNASRGKTKFPGNKSNPRFFNPAQTNPPLFFQTNRHPDRAAERPPDQFHRSRDRVHRWRISRPSGQPPCSRTDLPCRVQIFAKSVPYSPEDPERSPRSRRVACDTQL